MNESRDVQGDKSYVLLHEIDDNHEVTQRELAAKSGLSLGSVNILLKKMIHEGLVKMESIPANRVVYMLTPAGFVEKAQKTVRYVRHHYRVIESTKELIKTRLKKFHESYDVILVQRSEDEFDIMLEAAIQEYKNQNKKKKVMLFHDKDEVVKCLETASTRVIVFGSEKSFINEFYSSIHMNQMASFKSLFELL